MGGTGDIGGGGSCLVNFKVWKKGGNESNPDDQWDCKDDDAADTEYVTFDFPKEATGTVPGTVKVPLQKGVKVKVNWPRK